VEIVENRLDAHIVHDSVPLLEVKNLAVEEGIVPPVASAEKALRVSLQTGKLVCGALADKIAIEIKLGSAFGVGAHCHEEAAGADDVVSSDSGGE